MSIPQNKQSERWILDHWADLQPQDVGPFEARGVAYDGEYVVVTCTALAPPNPRTVQLDAANVEAAMIDDGALAPELEPDEAAAQDSATPAPAKPKASKASKT